jgi:acetoin utilization deacetylase AcuC-like enzyme
MSLHAWSSAHYVIPLPEGHRFPIEKYALLKNRVLDEWLVMPDDLHDPGRVSRDDLLRVHSHDWVDGFSSGSVDAGAMRRVGFPWSAELVERAWRAVVGTVEAADAALRLGITMNLAGGTHHAFAGHGEGFCVFNDVAVAIRRLQALRRVERAVIIDLDVHQGNGTNAIFADDDSVFTFSMHGRRNFPFHKVPGSLDVELDDGTGDDEYLALLERNLPVVLATAGADIAIYLAGADAHENDRLGRLGLTHDGIARRDALVLESCRAIGLPVAITIAGGYGRDINETVSIHARTARIAASINSPAGVAGPR